MHDPDSAQLRISYAEALARGGRLGSAEAEARRAVELADSPAARADAYAILADVLWTEGRADDAEHARRAAARVGPEVQQDAGAPNPRR